MPCEKFFISLQLELKGMNRMNRYLKHIAITCTTLAMPMVLSSCFKDEPLNAECDIEQVVVRVDNPEQMFFQVTDTLKQVLYTDSIINFNVRSHADLTALAPRFVLTEGATIAPDNGSVHDFSQGPVVYTVTSQDGKWHRRYKVSFTPITVTVNDTIKFDFEQFNLVTQGKSQYYVWRNTSGITTLGETWASGNEGFKISKSTAAPDEYPTIPLLDGYDGCGLKLITRDTGAFGRMSSKPIASGNLFIGTFDVTPAATDALKCTRFGMPFAQRPVKLTGYYKYKRGPKFMVMGENKQFVEDPTRQDEGSIYAVLYRNHDAQGNEVILLGDDVQTNPNIVAMAKMPKVDNTAQWTPFEIEFEYYTDIDEATLAQLGYNLTIVFASSIKGDLFEGAIDSELCIDKVRLICSHNE